MIVQGAKIQASISHAGN